MNVILAAALVPLAYAGGIDSFLEEYDRQMWYLGEDLVPGDYFVYDVCDAVHFRDGSCYAIRLDFYAELLSPAGDTWVVQAEITDGSSHDTTYHIFLIDSDTMEIRTDHAGSAHARSVENTVFYLSQFASPYSEKNIGVGSVWGEVPSSLGAAELHVASHDTAHVGDDILDVSILEYWVFRSSVFAVSESLGFPVSASVYDPRATLDDPSLAFAFTLSEFSSGRGQ